MKSNLALTSSYIDQLKGMYCADLRPQSCCCQFLSRSLPPCQNFLEDKKHPLLIVGSRPCHRKDLTPQQMSRHFLGDLSSCQVLLIPRTGMNWCIAVKMTNFSSCIYLIGTLSRTWLQREPEGKEEIIQVWIANVSKLHFPLDKYFQVLQYLASIPGQSCALGCEVSSNAGEYFIGIYKEYT